ncbi:MAG: AAA family ATPase [Desulfobacterales bacterium]|nr:AAA family ATPase [Desulfobacterales bacterium]
MYNRFWGFRQKPFKLVPNPDFLFLSSTHEEALAHLKFTLSEGEGFLMITGEVGTGKSTLCRAFLQELDSAVACAYIFNPKLNPLQLLKNINTEFGIPADADTAQELVEVLNAFLIEKKAEDQKVVIIIDEAQNLPVESLEQVRLLSNLETTRDKLLQIVLVGQPELAKMIDSFELRQLGQRISLACQLKPLSYDETVQYIQHRLNVASVKPQMPFEKVALNIIYRFSEGIPRLINTACDRMLLAACLKEQNTIRSGLANEIVDELSRQAPPQSSGSPWLKFGLATSAVLLLVILAVGLYFFRAPLKDLFDNRLSAANSPSPEVRVKIEPADAGAADNVKPVPDNVLEEPEAPAATDVMAGLTALPETDIPLEELVAAFRETDTRRQAVAAVLQQWGLEPQGDMDLAGVEDQTYFELIAERHGLLIHTVKDDLDELARLDLPAIIQLDLPQIDGIYYAGLIGIREGRYLLASYDIGVYAQVETDELERFWGGIAMVPWKNYLGYRGVIPDGAPRASVVVLKQLLWELGHSHLIINDDYDAPTRNAVREIQAKHGLVVDGLVGDLTKIVLYKEKQGLPIPHLRR